MSEYSGTFINIYLEKHKKHFFQIYCLNRRFFRNTNFINILRTHNFEFSNPFVSTPSPIKKKKKEYGSNIFFENYTYAKSHQNRWFTLRYVLPRERFTLARQTVAKSNLQNFTVRHLSIPGLCGMYIGVMWRDAKETKRPWYMVDHRESANCRLWPFRGGRSQRDARWSVCSFAYRYTLCVWGSRSAANN